MLAANLELVQVGVRPAHGGLKDVVQGIESCAAIEVDTAPDGRLDTHEIDAQDVVDGH